jgi:hypothetical protein
VAGKEPEREQFYQEASLLKLKNIDSKWQVKNQRENSSTWRPACTSSGTSTASGRCRTIERTVLPGGQPALAQEYLQQMAGIEPVREEFYLEASLLISSSKISTASGR